MNYFSFKVCIKYRVYHTFTLCLTVLRRKDRIICKTFNEVISRIDNLSPNLLKYVPNAEVMISISCCFFFNHNSFVLSYAIFQLRITTCQMKPLSTCQTLTGRVEKSSLEIVMLLFQERVGVLCSTHWPVYFYDKMFFYCVINVCKEEEKVRAAQKSHWLIYILCINAFPE